MGIAKDLLLKDEDLRGFALATVKKEQFGKLITFCKGEMMDAHGTSADQLVGANKFVSILLTIADDEPKPPAYPSSGLQHNLEVDRTKPKTETPITVYDP